jgi:hypothetical protein
MRTGPEVGLRHVETEHLRLLLKMVHREELRFPLTPLELARIGLQEPSERILGTLRGLEGRAVRAVLVAVLAERIES